MSIGELGSSHLIGELGYPHFGRQNVKWEIKHDNNWKAHFLGFYVVLMF